MSSPLPLALLPIGGGPHPQAKFFATAESAVQHLVNHLLTPPENEGWALLFEDGERLLHVKSPGGQFRLAREFLRDHQVAGPFYNGYRVLSCRAATDGAALGWVWRDGGDTKLLGVSGILLVVNAHHVRSAYLPGMGLASSNKQSKADPSSPLPRQKGSSFTVAGVGGRRLFRRRAHELEDREAWPGKQARGSELSPDEQDRWRLFFRSARHVRSELLGAYRGGRWAEEDPPALLREAVASPSKWKALSAGLMSGGAGVP
jgi:hypothetical protein